MCKWKQAQEKYLCVPKPSQYSVFIVSGFSWGKSGVDVSEILIWI